MLRFLHFLVWFHLDISFSLPTKSFLFCFSLIWKRTEHSKITLFPFLLSLFISPLRAKFCWISIKY